MKINLFLTLTFIVLVFLLLASAEIRAQVGPSCCIVDSVLLDYWSDEGMDIATLTVAFLPTITHLRENVKQFNWEK